jgi:tripartite-type tricarboxylate transporter receptor subunit TctC
MNERRKKMLRSFKEMVVFSTAISIALVLSVQGVVTAAEYPAKPITYWIGHRAGGTTDMSGRALAKAAEKHLGQKIVVINKPGGANILAASRIAKEKPDGYTISSINTTALILAPHRKDLSYDSRKDITPICQYASALFGLVVKSSSPWKTFNEFIDYIKKNPGVVVIGGSGTLGSPHQLTLAYLKKTLKLKFNQLPLGGSAVSVSALLGGHVTALSESSRWAPYVRSGDFRLLATYGEKRAESFPDVPTLRDLGFDYTSFGINGIGGPPGLPKPVVTKLENAFKKAFDDPEVVKVMRSINMPRVWRGSQEFRKHIAKRYEEAGAFIRELGLGKKKK